jgi:hypothetical protein
MSMVSMKMSKKEMKAETEPSLANENPYPYGLRISLDTDELEKLGITVKNLPKVGDAMSITATGCIVSVSEDETAGNGYRCSVQIQIEEMALENEGGEESAADELGESAENTTVHATRSVIRSTYRGR